MAAHLNPSTYGRDYRRISDAIHTVSRTSQMSDYDESKRRLRARIGGLSLHLRYNSDEIARKARAGFEARFYKEALEIDPTLEGTALEKNVQKRRSIYFTRMSLKSIETKEKKNRRSRDPDIENEEL